MKKYLLILLLCTVVFGGQYSFNSGELDPLVKYRIDDQRWGMGVGKMENILTKVTGRAYRRPGTLFVAEANGVPAVGSYPTLQVADNDFAVMYDDPGLTHTTAISNVTELQAMEDDLYGNYYLTGDIDASATSSWNDGEGFDPIGTFVGTFDGCGYTISDLTINRPEEDNVGLFSVLQYIEGGRVDQYPSGHTTYFSITNSTKRLAQSFTASKDYTISSVELLLKRGFTPGTVTVSIKATDEGTGQPTGEDLCSGTLNGDDFFTFPTWQLFEFETPYALTSGEKYAIVLQAAAQRIEWRIHFGGTYSGGYATTSTNSGDDWTDYTVYDFMFVTYETSTYVDADNKIANLTLSDCDITGKDHVGALAGDITTTNVYTSVIYNCHSTGNVSGENYVGGLIGSATGLEDYEVDINDCTSAVEVTGSGNDCGGLLGLTEGYIEIGNCRATGDVSGADNIGGFLGGLDAESVGTLVIDDCAATGDISGTKYIGGFVGYYCASPDISRCSARGSVTASGEIAGGFIGYADIEHATTIEDCYGWGDVVSGDYAGGFIGVSAGETMNNCYSVGTTTGTNKGGFSASESILENTTNSFWDTESSGEETSESGVGHVTSWMQTQSNFEDEEWDFDTVWEMSYTGPFFGEVRLIPFEYKEEDSYALEFGHQYIKFFRTVP